MGLKQQLTILISFIALVIPILGRFYIQEMDQRLKHEQVISLSAMSRVMTTSLEANHAILEQLLQRQAPEQTKPLYAHALKNSPILDGYTLDWEEQNIPWQSLSINSVSSLNRNDIFHTEVATGVKDQHIYLVLRAKTTTDRFVTPTRPLANANHLRLYLLEGDLLEGDLAGDQNRAETQASKAIVIYASGPGAIQASPIDHTSEERLSGLKGVWLEDHQGLIIELRFPLEWASRALGLSFHSPPSTPSTPITSSDSGYTARNFSRPVISQETPFPVPQPIPPLISRVKVVEKALQVYQRAGVKLQITSNHGETLASAGQLIDHNSDLHQQHGFRPALYRWALGGKTLPILPNTALHWSRDNRLDTPVVMQPAPGWYQWANSTVLRVKHAIHAPDEASPILAWLVIDQAVDALEVSTHSALSRLIVYSLIIIAFTLGVMMLYASWLSYRIRHLNRATQQSLEADGKITSQAIEDYFPKDTQQDEIGELSRNYRALLMQVKSYNRYLKTLASKLSHELRTPLAVVRSSLDNLEYMQQSRTRDNSAEETYIQRAKDGGARLSSILNALSSASHLEQAITTAERADLRLDTLLETLSTAYQSIHTQHHLHFFQKNASGQPIYVHGSEELLVQMLDKLVDNAADFCPAGGSIILQVDTEIPQKSKSSGAAASLHTPSSVHQLCISLYNDGPPLPPGFDGQLFDSLVSVRNPSSSDNHHLGLGLYIARLIVEFHKGTIQAKNTRRPNPHHKPAQIAHTSAQGVRFDIFLPFFTQQHTD